MNVTIYFFCGCIDGVPFSFVFHVLLSFCSGYTGWCLRGWSGYKVSKGTERCAFDCYWMNCVAVMRFCIYLQYVCEIVKCSVEMKMWGLIIERLKISLGWVVYYWKYKLEIIGFNWRVHDYGGRVSEFVGTYIRSLPNIFLFSWSSFICSSFTYFLVYFLLLLSLFVLVLYW